jgi:hypothetical protein
MMWAWWAVGSFCAAALLFHEMASHHILARLLRRQVQPSEHLAMWDALGRRQRSEIQAEMLVMAGMASAVTALHPLLGILLAGVTGVIASVWILFGRHA